MERVRESWGPICTGLASPGTQGHRSRRGRLQLPVPEVRRDRVLTDDELRWFWKATDKLGLPFGPLFKMLALTGQRLSEVAGMAPGEVKTKERLWTIPKVRMKNNQEHDVPLSNAALEIIEAMPKIKGDAGHVYVFTTTGNSPVSGWSRAKNSLDKAMLVLARLVDAVRAVAELEFRPQEAELLVAIHRWNAEQA